MPGTSAGSYAHILGLPAVLRTFALTLLGRLTYGVLPLALLFTIQGATGSFAIAASAMGLNGLASLSMPIKSRVIDCYGQRVVLPVISVSLVVALGGAALLASSGLQHTGAWLATALLIGLASPPLGPSMRAQWRLLVPREQLTAAYSLDAVAEESLYLIGPVIAAGLLAVAPPYAGLLVCAGLVVVGGLGLATSPVADRRTDATQPRVGLGPLRHAHFLALLAVMAVVGLISATVFTATAARALAAGQPSLAGVADAVVAVGSVAGGLWWGRAAPAWSTTRSLARLMSVLGLFSLVAGALDSFWLFTVALAGAGAALAPVYVVAYQASDHAVAPEEVTEASTWVNTAANLGVSLGAAVAGALVSSHGAHAPSVAGGAAALVVVAVVTVAAATK